MKIIHRWAESASTGLKLTTVCMCVSFTSAESCAKLQYIMLSLRSHTSRDVLDQLLLALATSIRVSGSVWEGSTRLLLIIRGLTQSGAGFILCCSLAFVQSNY